MHKVNTQISDAESASSDDNYTMTVATLLHKRISYTLPRSITDNSANITQDGKSWLQSLPINWQSKQYEQIKNAAFPPWWRADV
jgi:hypothetical protein